MKHLLFVLLCVLIVAVITGCGETENPVTDELTADSAAFSTIAKMKMPAVDTAPGAPTAPAGTPFVKEVGFYRDWKRTKALTGAVKPGSTIHINIVFSEGMKLVLADDKEARPILYYKIGEKLRRFKVVGYKATGKDFTSGDAKPVGNQATYYARYVVKQADMDNLFTIAVGKFSPDRQGNTLADFYTHNETLQCGPVPPKETVKEEPTEQPADTVSPTVLSITHSHRGEPIEDALPEGTTIETQVVFSERVTPAITYTTGDKTSTYRVSQTVGGVHWRGFCKPTNTTGTMWICRQSVAHPSFTVTVTTDTIDLAGNPLQEETTTEAVPVTERVTPPPQEPVDVPDTPPTGPDEPTSKHPDDLGYTFTLEGLTYPGYNPSPGLQHILDLHPSTKLPHFEEAVQMEEVIDWVYWKVWTVYPDSVDKRVAARKAVEGHFGLPPSINVILPRIYFKKPQGSLPGHSRYWMKVEYLRLKLQHPEANKDQLYNLFLNSTNNGLIVGIVNPNE